MRTKTLIAGLLLTCGFCGASFAQDDYFGRFALDNDPVLVRPGETTMLKVKITDISGPGTIFYIFSFNLSYPEGISMDPSDVHLIRYPDGLFKNGFIDTSNNPDTRKFGVLVVGAPEGSPRPPEAPEGPAIWPPIGPVVEVPVIVAADASSGVYNFPILEGYVEGGLDSVGKAELTAFTVQVTGSGGPGDVDGNGQVSISDAQWALQLYVKAATGSPGVLKSADVSPENGDGQITLADVQSILKMAVGLDNEVN